MNNFQHQHTAHCESGVMSTMLKAQGVDFNEAMVFGLASALTFVYIPLVKVNGMPLISYRMPPKSIHFNAHNLIVYGKEQNDYLISDPVFETVQCCAAEDLQRARFVKGVLAPKGLMYYFESQPDLTKIDLPSITRKAIRKNAKQMLAPLFFIGVKGIRTVAKQIEKLANHPSDKYKRLYLGHIVRMQEEIGTGGAGFRYLYAYFLEQAADICQEPRYKQASEQMTEIGDMWRQFAGLCVKQCKKPTIEGYHTVAEYLRDIANKEQQIWQTLRNL